jgi:leucyl-tRNA synthetase
MRCSWDLYRVWRLFIDDNGDVNARIGDVEGTAEFQRVWHKTIKKITEDYEGLRFNTAISQLMIFVNEAYKSEQLPKEAMKHLAQMLSPIVPHIAEELWSRLGGEGSITYAAWPEYDIALTVDNEVEIVVQVNGKIVERLLIPADMEQAEMEQLAHASIKVIEAIAGRSIRKVIAVKGKLVNIVVG